MCFYTITERRLKPMLYYEIKKLLSRTGSKILLLLLGAILILTCFYNIQTVQYRIHDGSSVSGIVAISKLKESKSKWNGELTTEQIRRVLQTNQNILEDNPSYYPGTPDIALSNKVYSLTQEFSDIRDMINSSYNSFNSYDYYLIDSLSPEQSIAFYENRSTELENYLATNNDMTKAQKNFYRNQYSLNNTPWQYMYQEGWKILANSLSSLQIFCAIIISLLLASLFSYEDKTKAKTILLTTYKGKTSATLSKIFSGLILSTVLYSLIIGTFILTILSVFGFDGATNPIQTNFFFGWESPWNITNIQAIGLMFLCGLIGTLFFAGITMFISYKSKSTAIASIVSFILILLPNWLSNFASNQSLITLIKLLPDQLLNSRPHLSNFTFLDIHSLIISPLTIMNIAYFILTIILLSILFFQSKNEYIK